MQIEDVKIEVVVCGPLQTNTVIIAADGCDSCCVIDPSEPLDEIFSLLEQESLTVGEIVVTHGHGDHISGVGRLWEKFPQAKFYAPTGDQHMLDDTMANLSAPFGMATTAPQPSRFVDGGESLQLASRKWSVIDTSGHSPGGITLHNAEIKVAICGDAIFCGSIGRCDLPGSDMQQLLANLKNNIFTLPGETLLIPGHGAATSVDAEIKDNPFF